MKIVYLDAWALGDTDLEPLECLGQLAAYDSTEPGELAERLAGAEVIITNKVAIDGDVLALAPDCGLVVASATGTDHIDAEACAAHGAVVRNVADYATESVAQYTLAAALELTVRLRARHRFVVSGEYEARGLWTQPRPYWRQLGGTWGVIGLGAIGRRVGELARAFECETVFFSASGSREAESGWRQVGLDELLATSRVVSIHAPGVPRYRGLLDADRIARLRPKSLLLSVGRGGIVDEAAVASALAREALAGAAFDVFGEEPPARESPLLDPRLADRVLLSPHMAWTSEQARRNLVEGIAERIADYAGAK